MGTNLRSARLAVSFAVSFAVSIAVSFAVSLRDGPILGLRGIRLRSLRLARLDLDFRPQLLLIDDVRVSAQQRRLLDLVGGHLHDQVGIDSPIGQTRTLVHKARSSLARARRKHVVLRGQLELGISATVAARMHGLHRTLAEAAIADDDGAIVGLERARDDLARAG